MPRYLGLLAIGDTVNVAARLQDMTKTLNCTVVVSEEVWKTSGIAVDALPRTDVSIRGRDEPMTVRTAADPTVLSSMLDPQAGPLSAELQIHKPGIDAKTDGRHVHF